MDITIALCTYGKWTLLENSLEAIESYLPSIQKYFPAVEVMIVNNSPVSNVPKELTGKFNNFNFINLDVDLFSEQRNYCISHAKANLIAYVDDDFTINQNFSHELKYFLETEFGMFQFHFLSCIDFTPPYWFNPNWVSNPWFQEERGELKSGWVTGCCMAIKKDKTYNLMFNPNFGAGRKRLNYSSEDAEFEFQYLRSGGKIGYSPVSVGFHQKSKNSLQFYLKKDNRHYYALQLINPNTKTTIILAKKCFKMGVIEINKLNKNLPFLKISLARLAGSLHGYMDHFLKKHKKIPIPKRSE